ncbi:MAG: transketolase [Methanomicrobiales archaeon]|nr:transketolase [Methanomicrobiales archaeon]
MESGNYDNLNEIATRLRRHILEMTARAGSGHYMSSFSCVEILAALYFQEMQVRPDDPAWPGRDRFVLGKGHAAPALYAVLAERGYFPVPELMTLRQVGSRLQGHPVKSYGLPGLDASSGSLGQGISTAVGIALAAQLDGADWRVFVLLGDGECQEGQVWEAAMAAAHFKCDNLVVIVDYNALQSTGTLDEIMSLGDLRAKWEAFGWSVTEARGHDFGSLQDALAGARARKGMPHLILAHTMKGHGVPFIEGNLEYHSKPLSADELAGALHALEVRH